MDKEFVGDIVLLCVIILLVGGIEWLMAFSERNKKKEHFRKLFNMDIGEASQEARVTEMVCYAQQFKCVHTLLTEVGFDKMYKTPIGIFEIRFCCEGEDDKDALHLVRFENQYLWHPYYSGSYRFLPGDFK